MGILIKLYVQFYVHPGAVGGEMAKEAKYYLELTQDNWDFTMGLPTNDNVLRY